MYKDSNTDTAADAANTDDDSLPHDDNRPNIAKAPTHPVLRLPT